MKNIIILAICVVLAAVAFWLPLRAQSDEICGIGAGEDAKISTLEELGDVLCSLTDGEIDGYAAVGPLSYEVSSAAEDNKYESVTLSVNTRGRIKGKSSLYTDDYGSSYSGSASYSCTISRAMTCYFTQSEAYYEIECDITLNQSAYTSSSSSQDVVAGVSMECAIYLSEKLNLCKFSRCSILSTVNGERQSEVFPVKALNKWIDLESADEWLDATEMNYEQLQMIGEYISDVGTEKFTKTDKVYKLLPSKSREFCSDLCDVLVSTGSLNGYISAENFDNAEVSINLRDKKSPLINVLYSYNYESGSDLSYSHVDIGAAEQTSIRLSHINNTSINFPYFVTIYNMQDFE